MILERSLFGLLLGLLLSGASAFAASTEDERVQQLLKDAKGFCTTERFDLAARRCEQALKLDPANKNAAIFLEQIKRAEAAQKDREVAKVIRPTYPPQQVGRITRSSEFK